MLDPIIDGYHLTRVLMDGGSSLKLIYQDSIHGMGIDPSRINQNNATFNGVIPGVMAHCWGSLVLEVTFSSPDNFKRENLLFNIAPFSSDYHALLGRPAFACFNAIPTYACLKLKMPDPSGIITVSGNTEQYAAVPAAGL